MERTRAVLFDFGGTLYDYRVLAAAEEESLVELARWCDIPSDPAIILPAHRNAMRVVFRSYLSRRFYLHRDMFRDAVSEMVRQFGVEPAPQVLDRYRAAQWERHARDFVLRPGVIETLEALRAQGVHLGLVSNIDDDQLRHLLVLGSLERYFDSVVSSEQAQSCKPDRTIFTMALSRAACRPEEALFVGDTIGQDIAGANQAGMRSVLLWHRDDREPPTSGPIPRHVIRTIPDVLELLRE